MRVDDGYRRLFYKVRGTFIKEVHLSNYGSQFTFHLCKPTLRGPFRIRIEWSGVFQNFRYEMENFEAPVTPLKVEFPGGETVPEYDVKLWLNDDIAYFGKFTSEGTFLNPF
ncbi:MAG: hypothetical protein OXI01_21725 [Albidovulum sp.]|nr:hypothetical protein [Albidovulum sp.]